VEGQGLDLAIKIFLKLQHFTNANYS